MFLIFKKKNLEFFKKVSPEIKLLLFFIITSSLFYLQNIEFYLLISGTCLFIYIIIDIAIKPFLKQLKKFGIFLVGIFTIKVLLNNYLEAVLIILRFLNLFLIANLITITTPTSEFVSMIKRFLKKLNVSDKKSQQICLSITLTINFIPYLKKNYNEIRLAQKSRNENSGILYLLTPLTIKIIKSCDEISESIDSRLS